MGCLWLQCMMLWVYVVRIVIDTTSGNDEGDLWNLHEIEHHRFQAMLTRFLPTLLHPTPAASRAAAGLQAALRRWPAARPPHRGQRPSPSSACRGCAQSVRAQMLCSVRWPDAGMHLNLLQGNLQCCGQVLEAIDAAKLETARSWQAQTNCHAYISLHRPRARHAKAFACA